MKGRDKLPYEGCSVVLLWGCSLKLQKLEWEKSCGMNHIIVISNNITHLNNIDI